MNFNSISDIPNKKAVINILSPLPRQLKAKLKSSIPNPFFDKIPIAKCLEDEKTINELRIILDNQDSPLSKKTSSPFCYRNRPPTRQKLNPIIFDAQFLEINSSASTCEDSSLSIS